MQVTGMAIHTIKKGLNLPLAGAPAQSISPARQPSTVALIADDYLGLRPTIFAKVGDTVQRGQALFEDKKNPGVIFTAPAAGVISAINRGDRRAFQSIVIELSANEREGAGDQVVFPSYSGKDIASIGTDDIRALMVESGLWTSFRTRPFSKVPALGTSPTAIFVTAIDTNPHAPSIEAILAGSEPDFERGLMGLAKLSPGKVFLCKAKGANVPAGSHNGVSVEEFEGAHPAGNPGLHIHRLAPVTRAKVAWHIGLQDVIALGHLLGTGKLRVERIVALAGPGASNPRLLRTRLGAALDDITAGELNPGDVRVISGSVLAGRTAAGPIFGYLGRYHQQIACLQEGRNREFLGWLAPGKHKYSTIPIYTSSLSSGAAFNLNTSLNGSHRAMVPIGLYERVMPMDIEPTFLLRALIVGDLEQAELLGCLELDEEDLALCTFVCPGKYEYGPILRQALDRIEKEG